MGVQSLTLRPPGNIEATKGDNITQKEHVRTMREMSLEVKDTRSEVISKMKMSLKKSVRRDGRTNGRKTGRTRKQVKEFFH